jgi:hypothetical protein
MLTFGAARGKRPWGPCQGKKMLLQADPGATWHVSVSARASLPDGAWSGTCFLRLVAACLLFPVACFVAGCLRLAETFFRVPVSA